MSYYPNRMSVGDKLFGQTDLEAGQATLIKQTYMFLSLSVIAAMIGGYIGSNSPTIIRFFSSWIGWIAALLILNGIPMLAMALRHNPVLGFAALLLDGFVAGLVLGPILAFANYYAPDVILTAAIITGIIFLSVTGYVMTSKRTFSAPRGLMVGIFFALVGATALNMFLNYPMLSVLISVGVGVLGVFILIHATSEVLNNPEVDSPIGGALMLFAGLFNVFIAVLSLLLSFTSRD